MTPYPSARPSRPRGRKRVVCTSRERHGPDRELRGGLARQRNLLEPGDVESGLAAAAAIGDDRLQRQRPMDDLQKHLTTGYEIHRRIHEQYRVLYPTEGWWQPRPGPFVQEEARG
jgi:hypothetical protein